MKLFSYLTPERKVGEVFLYNGGMYQVMDGNKQPLANREIGCAIKDPSTGNIIELCAFSNYCGRVNRRHRGYCVPSDRKDNKTVYFKKL